MKETTAQQVDPAVPESMALAGPDRPIFVVACPRSGTTLLQLMLHAHPRIAIPPENRFFLETYRARRKFGDLRKPARREQLGEWVINQRKIRHMKVPKEILKEKVAQAPPTIGSALGVVLREYAAFYGKPRWGDKRPLYLNHIPTILALFPDAQFIHIVRDGRDCVASLKRMPWWKTGSTAAITRWVQSMNMGRRAAKTLRPDQWFEFKYEDLVAEPRPILERMCEYLGEEFDEAMLEPHRATPKAAVPKKKTWHGRTREAVSTASMGRWESELEPWELAVIERLGRRHFKRYGYELSGTGGMPPPGKLVAAARHLAEREYTTYKGRRADAERQQDYGHPVAALLTSGQLALAADNGELEYSRAKPPKAKKPDQKRRRRSRPEGDDGLSEDGSPEDRD